MSSRKPPSQRDPEFVLARTVTSLRQVVGASSRMANNTPVTSAARQLAQLRGAPRPSGGGDTTHPGTGTDSMAVGAGADASGNYSVAVGTLAAATGGYSIAVGRMTSASGGGIAVGATADSDGGVAIGGNTTGNGLIAIYGNSTDSGIAIGGEASTQGIALGEGATSGDYNIAIGSNAGPHVGDPALTAGGAVMIGDEARATDANGIAVGYHAVAAADAVAVGRQANASGVRSIAIGKSAYATTDDTTVVATDSVELQPSSGATGSSVIVWDTVSGAPMRISVASGVLVVAPA
jgi:hypothetical protein